MDVFHDLDKLAVLLTAIVAGDWYTIAQVCSEGENVIINDQGATQVDAFEDAQIFVQRLLTFVSDCLCMLPEEPVLY